MIDKYCRNCGRYNPAEICKYDVVKQWQYDPKEKKKPCPMWTPMTITDDEFRAEVMRKVEENR